MIKTFLTKGLLVSGLFVASAACASTAKDKTHKIVSAESSQGYVKPGASVKLRHDFSGKINPGQVGDFSVDLIMPPTDGIVKVSFSGSEGLDVLSGGDTREVSVNKAAFIDETAPLGPQRLQVRAQDDGLYYLNAFVDVIYPNGQKQSRVITMPISVGNGQAKSSAIGVSIDESSGRAIAVMSADETIE